jgi:hypothetical protein
MRVAAALIASFVAVGLCRTPPARAATIRVSTTGELQAALQSAHGDPGRVIELVPGRYEFRGSQLVHLGRPGRGEAVRGLTVRGLGRQPGEVVLAGGGMDPGDPATGFGFILSEATDITFENFEIRGVREHLFHVKGENGADRVTFRRLRLVDAGTQFIKGTANQWIDGADDGVVEDCSFEYTIRDYLDRRIETVRPPLVAVESSTQVVVKVSPASLNRTSYPVDYWRGATIGPRASNGWTRTVLSSAPVAGTPSQQRLVVDAAPPEAWSDNLELTLDRPDQRVTAWGPKGGYTHAIDVHTGKRWVVRRSSFVRIGTSLRSNYDHSVAAILFWHGSEGTQVEDVAFLDCESGVVLGLGSDTGPGQPWNHRWGVVRRALFYRQAGVRGDRAFGFESSANARIEDAKVVLNGTYGAAVEYRFPATTGFVARNIESDANGVVARASPGPASIDNVRRLADSAAILDAVRQATGRDLGPTPTPDTRRPPNSRVPKAPQLGDSSRDP